MEKLAGQGKQKLGVFAINFSPPRPSPCSESHHVSCIVSDMIQSRDEIHQSHILLQGERVLGRAVRSDTVPCDPGDCAGPGY